MEDPIDGDSESTPSNIQPLIAPLTATERDVKNAEQWFLYLAVLNNQVAVSKSEVIVGIRGQYCLFKTPICFVAVTSVKEYLSQVK